MIKTQYFSMVEMDIVYNLLLKKLFTVYDLSVWFCLHFKYNYFSHEFNMEDEIYSYARPIPLYIVTNKSQIVIIGKLVATSQYRSTN